MRWTSFVIGFIGFVLASPLCAQPFPITDFESFSTGAEVMFQEPRFSGSTSGFLATTPNLSAVSEEQSHSGVKSYKVSWQFTGIATNKWLRLTTFNTGNIPNPAIDFSLQLRFHIYVPTGTPDFYVTLGVRETNTTAGIGQNGGTTGAIEWVGATGSTGASAPIGKLIDLKNQWVEVVFDIPNEPVRGFTGNGILESTTGRGTLEHLAFTPVDSTQLGPYTIYMDDFRQVPEPTSLAALGMGLLGLALRRRRAV